MQTPISRLPVFPPPTFEMRLIGVSESCEISGGLSTLGRTCAFKTTPAQTAWRSLMRRCPKTKAAGLRRRWPEVSSESPSAQNPESRSLPRRSRKRIRPPPVEVEEREALTNASKIARIQFHAYRGNRLLTGRRWGSTTWLAQSSLSSARPLGLMYSIRMECLWPAVSLTRLLIWVFRPLV